MEIDEQLRPYVKIFPATELKPYAEPVSPNEMKEGRVYFALQFLDEELLVPVLQPLIFLGYNLDGEDPNLRYFQHFDSFIAGVRYPAPEQEELQCFEAYGPEEGKHIFEYDHALEVLMRCGLSRREIAELDQRICRSKEPPHPDEPSR
jgi:hypothetical protein